MHVKAVTGFHTDGISLLWGLAIEPQKQEDTFYEAHEVGYVYLVPLRNVRSEVKIALSTEHLSAGPCRTRERLESPEITDPRNTTEYSNASRL